MRYAFLSAGILFFCGVIAAQNGHPRLFLREGEEKALMANIRQDDTWSRMHDAIVAECAVIDTLPLCERVIKGPRMHAVSCEVLRRVLFLSYAYRMTGKKAYAQRAEQEMLKAASFSDWNPYKDILQRLLQMISLSFWISLVPMEH